jgi:hypothetical protein
VKAKQIKRVASWKTNKEIRKVKTIAEILVNSGRCVYVTE